MRAVLQILFFVLLARPLLGLLIGVNVLGRENLAKAPQFVLVANHNSHLDTLALLSLFPLSRLRHIRPVAASDYFMNNALLRWFSTTVMNILPIPREGFTKSNNPLALMGAALEAGDSIILFPEGSRGEPERMAPFRKGIAHVLEKHPEVPVIPVFIKGMGKSLPKGEVVLVPFFCDIVIGEPRKVRGSRDEIVRSLESAVSELREELILRFGLGEDGMEEEGVDQGEPGQPSGDSSGK